MTEKFVREIQKKSSNLKKRLDICEQLIADTKTLINSNEYRDLLTRYPENQLGLFNHSKKLYIYSLNNSFIKEPDMEIHLKVSNPQNQLRITIDKWIKPLVANSFLLMDHRTSWMVREKKYFFNSVYLGYTPESRVSELQKYIEKLNDSNIHESNISTIIKALCRNPITFEIIQMLDKEQIKDSVI